VTVVCPPNYPGSLPIRVNLGTSGVRLWSDADETTLLDGVANESVTIQAGGATPTTFYVEAMTASEDGGNPITFTFIGAGPSGMPSNYYEHWRCPFDGDSESTAISPVGVSLAFDGAEAGDPDATVPIDDSTDETGANAQYSTLDLNLPANLAEGTTVTLSMDASVAQLADVYASKPSSGSAAPIIGTDAGTTSYTWTVGSDDVPSAVYVEAFDNFGRLKGSGVFDAKDPGSAGEQ
jgi:hypothetical protein